MSHLDRIHHLVVSVPQSPQQLLVLLVVPQQSLHFIWKKIFNFLLVLCISSHLSGSLLPFLSSLLRLKHSDHFSVFIKQTSQVWLGPAPGYKLKSKLLQIAWKLQERFNSEWLMRLTGCFCFWSICLPLSSGLNLLYWTSTGGMSPSRSRIEHREDRSEGLSPGPSLPAIVTPKPETSTIVIYDIIIWYKYKSLSLI